MFFLIWIPYSESIRHAFSSMCSGWRTFLKNEFVNIYSCELISICSKHIIFNGLAILLRCNQATSNNQLLCTLGGRSCRFRNTFSSVEFSNHICWYNQKCLYKADSNYLVQPKIVWLKEQMEFEAFWLALSWCNRELNPSGFPHRTIF